MKKYLAIILLTMSHHAFSEAKRDIEKTLEKDKIQVSICQKEIKNNSENIINECSIAFKMVINSSFLITQIKEDFNKPYINNDLPEDFKLRVKNTIELHEKIKNDLYSSIHNLSEGTILKITGQEKE